MHGNKIAVLISSSPIASHPSTAIIEETLRSIRYHLPTSPIYIMLDGVRSEQQHHTDRYIEYIMTLVGKTLLNFQNIRIVPFLEFTHQAAMTKKALELTTAPMILFVEHDTPLVDAPIDWEMLTTVIENGKTNHIRLHYDQEIHPDHQYLMCGRLTPHLIKTRQWHQRPHLANRAWYASVLQAIFNEKSRCFIEDRVYTFVENAPWEEYKLTIYDPEGTGENMKRSRDLNGRAGQPKFDDLQVFG